MKTKIIIAFIAGILMAVFSSQAYVIYSVRNEVSQDHQVLLQVVQVIQQAQQGAAKQ